MQVFVQGNKTYTLDVKPTDTIQDLKGKIQDRTGITIEEQRLVYNRKQLTCNTTLRNHNIKHFSIIHLIVSLSDRSKNKAAVMLDIDISKIVQFIPSMKSLSQSYSMKCDASLTLESILKELDILYLSDSIEMQFQTYNSINISFKYSQIYHKPILSIKQIEYIIDEQTNTLNMQLNLIRSSFPQTVILNEAFIEKMTAYFNSHELDDDEEQRTFSACTKHELNIMFQMISLLNTLKSNDSLLHSAAICTKSFMKYGIPSDMNFNEVDHIVIPAILNVISYKNDNQNENILDKVRKILLECLFNIASKGKRSKYFRLKIFNELQIFADPCQSTECLLAVTKFYTLISTSHRVFDHSDFEILCKQLHILLFYENDDNILLNVLQAFVTLNNSPKNVYKWRIHSEERVIIKEKYVNKQHRMKLFFDGFIRQILKTMEYIEYMPDDVCYMMFGYYNFYECMNINLIIRTMQILDRESKIKNYKIRHKAMDMVCKFIRPSSNALRIKHSSLYSNIINNGFIAGLFKCISHTLWPFMKKDKQLLSSCGKCHKVKKGVNTYGETNFLCFQCFCVDFNVEQTIMSVLDVIEFSLKSDEDVKMFCIDKIKRNNGVSMLINITKIEPNCIGEGVILKTQKILSVYLSDKETTPPHS